MPKLTAYELEREANIAKNRALLEQLDVKGAITNLALPADSKVASKVQGKAKPVQPARKNKRTRDEVPVATRQSLRLRRETIDPNESPSKRLKREQSIERRRQLEEQERLEAEERARQAKKPRHHDLELSEITEDLSQEEQLALKSTLDLAPQPRRIGIISDFVYDNDSREKREVSALREDLSKMKVISRAKVTQDRIYSTAYHPEKAKDLIFFGDKHGQLGIWDARAPPDEKEDEDGDIASENQEGGKYWRLQPHWPATAKSSISAIKMNPVDSHGVFTSAYDCTIRSLSFTTGTSREVFSTENVLISSIDLPPTGNEMWISDTLGGISHIDLRESKTKAIRWELSESKIGCISINPIYPTVLLTASNDRSLKVWDSRKLSSIPINKKKTSTESDGIVTIDFEEINEYRTSKLGHGMLQAEYAHNKSVSSAYWDPRGRSVVSTCYDDALRIWELNPQNSSQLDIKTFSPSCYVRHNCQTGRWLTVLKAQWTPNPEVYPHFTVGNMNHSLDIYSCKGELLARLSDPGRITAVQAVTCSHPSVVQRAVSGNASGRCVLWAEE